MPRQKKKKKLLAVESSKENAESLRKLLRDKGLHADARPIMQEGKVFFPLSEAPPEDAFKSLDFEVLLTEKPFRVYEPKKGLKEMLEGKLSEQELGQVFRAYTVVGDIAVVEIPQGLEDKEKEIGKALLSLHKNVNTVVREAGERTNVYRIQRVKVIAGEPKTVTVHKEHGCLFKVDLNKTFFSGRLSGERKRIAEQVKQGEIIGAFFAGVGPFPIVIMKHSRAERAYAIELNPDSIELLRENLSLNRMHGKIEIIQGDVREEADRLAQKFDRVLMPLPKGGEDFLPSALKTVKRGGIIHFYQFAEKDSPFEEAVKLVKLRCAEQGRKCQILKQHVLRSYSPRVVQIVVDFKVL